MKKIILIILISIGFLLFSKQVEAKNDDKHILELTNYSINSFYAYGADNPVDIYEDTKGNQYLHLSDKGKEYTSFYFDSVSAITRSATYRIEMDVRYDENFDTDNFFLALLEDDLAQPTAWTIANSKAELDEKTTAIPNSDFRHLVFDFKVEKFFAHTYEYIKIGYHVGNNLASFIDIDNIQIFLGSEITFNEDINIDADNQGDFEDFSDDIYTGDFRLESEDNNHYMIIDGASKMQTVRKEISASTNETRNYELVMKVKKGSNYNGDFSFSIPNANVSKTTIDLAGVYGEWQEISVPFKPTVNNNTSSYLLLNFQATNPNIDNYLAIDDIQIIRKSTGVNIDLAYNGDFEANAILMADAGWYSDDVYHVNPNDLHNSVINVNENKVLKLYSYDDSDTAITKKVNTENFSKKGWYELEFKILGGKNFYIENLGFRLQSSDQIGYHASEVILDTSKVNSEEWVTIKSSFYVPNNSNSDWIHFDLWCFSRNDLAMYQSADNYVLIDDIKFYRMEKDMSFGDNLLDNGDISGFKTSQGRTDLGLLSLEGYDYSRDLIAKDFLNQFNENTKLTSNFQDRNYMGTIDLDIAPKFGDEGKYHYMCLGHDGMAQDKIYSSATYLLHMFDFTINNRYTLEFDYKLNQVYTDIIRFAFISVDNEDDFLIDLTKVKLGENKTEGINKQIYTYTVSDNGDGWYHICLTFQPDVGFKSRVNSMRFLLRTYDGMIDDKFYVANFNLKEYSKTELSALPDIYLTPEVKERGCRGSICLSLMSLSLLCGAIYLLKKRG